MVTRSTEVQESNTLYARVALSTGDRDSHRALETDIIRAGDGHCNPKP